MCVCVVVISRVCFESPKGMPGTENRRMGGGGGEGEGGCVYGRGFQLRGNKAVQKIKYCHLPLDKLTDSEILKQGLVVLPTKATSLLYITLECKIQQEVQIAHCYQVHRAR